MQKQKEANLKKAEEEKKLKQDKIQQQRQFMKEDMEKRKIAAAKQKSKLGVDVEIVGVEPQQAQELAQEQKKVLEAAAASKKRAAWAKDKAQIITEKSANQPFEILISEKDYQKINERKLKEEKINRQVEQEL